MLRLLGGVQIPRAPFRTGRWDFTDGRGLYLEFDEFEHFNRERHAILSVPWSDQHPWAAAYRRYCVEHGHRARTYGKFWTSPSTEKQFGPAGYLAICLNKEYPSIPPGCGP